MACVNEDARGLSRLESIYTPQLPNQCAVLLRPLDLQLPVGHGTIPQIEIDQVLVRHTHLRRKRLEIRHGRLVQPNRDRLLQMLDVRVSLPLHLREVVAVSHGFTSNILLLRACLPCAQR
jgi:hypothetical protein